MRLCSKGRALLNSHKRDRIDQFDSPRLRDRMHTLDDGDDTIVEIAEAVGRANYAMSAARDLEAGENPVHEHASDGWGSLLDALDARLDELVAEECATVVTESEAWHWDDDEQADAVHEAREWLQTNQEIAKRAGVWSEVVGDA